MSFTSDDRVASDGVTSFAERRSSLRQSLASAVVYVDFGADNGGIVLNLSEDGFSVQTAMPLAPESLSSMRLKGDADGGCIEVCGRIAWISDSRKTAGIQFVGLSDAARQQIARWIALEASPQRHDQPLSRAGQHASNGAASARPRRSPGQPPSDADRSSDSLADDDPDPRPARKLLHLVHAESSASKPGSSGSPVAAVSKDALSEFEEILRKHDSEEAAATPGKFQTPPIAGTPLTSWNAAVSVIFILAVFTFAAGLVAGYILVERPSKAAANAALSLSAAPQAQHAVTADHRADHRMVAFSGTDPAPLHPRAARIIDLGPIAVPQHSGAGARSRNRATREAREPSAAVRQIPRSDPIGSRIAADPSDSRTRYAVAQIPQSSSLLPATPHTIQLAPSEQPIDPPGPRSPESPRPIQVQTAQSAIERPSPAEASPNPSAKPANVLSTATAAAPAPGNTSAISSAAAANTGPSARREPRILPSASPAHMIPGRLIQSVEPLYPRDARALRLEGDVELRVVVGTDGTVRSVKLVSGTPLLAAAAMDAARHFRYSPALLNGQPIETIQTIHMSFRLKH